MNGTNIITTLIVSGIIAIAVSIFVVPRLSPVSPSEVDRELRAQAAATTATERSAQAPVAGTARRSARLYRKDGHFHARTVVNKKATVEFMVDTGASIVALTYDDARRLGLKPETLDYRWKISTAGGETFGASVRLDSIKINQIHIRDVDAMVLRSDLEQSLLGMSFLNKLYSYEFRGDQMVIRQ